jgi:flagellar basal body rod protein FlgF
VAPGALMTYTEAHYHGQTGGIQVPPKARVTVHEEGRFSTTFSLVRGWVGQ